MWLSGCPKKAGLVCDKRQEIANHRTLGISANAGAYCSTICLDAFQLEEIRLLLKRYEFRVRF